MQGVYVNGSRVVRVTHGRIERPTIWSTMLPGLASFCSTGVDLGTPACKDRERIGWSR